MQHLTNNGKSIEQTNSWKIKMVIYKRYVKPMEMARDMKKLFLRAKWDFSGSFGKRMKPQEKNYSSSWGFILVCAGDLGEHWGQVLTFLPEKNVLSDLFIL